MHEIRAAAKRAIAKTNKTIARLEEWLENAESAEKLQYDADLLMIYHREVPRKTKEVTLTDPATNEHVKIALDPSRSGLENAQALYERAKRLRRGRVLVRRKLKRLKDEIRLLEDGLGRVEEGVSMSDRAAALLPSHPMKKKNQTATAFRIYSIGGYTVRVGKNARQNDELLREAKPNDLWLHARGVAGSHVVVSRQDKGAISDEVVAAAARLAARHSKARHEKHVPVVITEVKHVRKPKGAPDGLVIVQQEDTLVVDLSVAEEE
jgi:predicted ribosome quality control (RQC) complex YloA/Tae2 family protein